MLRNILLTWTTAISRFINFLIAWLTGLRIVGVDPLVGWPGTIFTISGRGFSNNRDDNVVFIGAARALVIEAAENRLLAMAGETPNDRATAGLAYGLRGGRSRNVEDMIERRHARLHAIAKLSPGPPRAVMSDKTRVPCKALRMVASKQLSHARKLEPAVSAFNEQAHARECSKQAIDPVF
jgi:hypothetical protein